MMTALSSPQVVPVHEEPSHRPVFANAEVRVLDVVLTPGVPTPYHTHVHDQVGVTIAPGPTRFQLLGEDPAPDDLSDRSGDVDFERFPKPVAHRGTNLGETPIHYLVLELLGPAPTRAQALPPAAGAVVLENRRVRVSRLRLEPGAAAPPHAHANGVVIGSLSDGTIIDGGAPSPWARPISPGFVSWQDPTREHAVRNAGGRPLELVELEILR